MQGNGREETAMIDLVVRGDTVVTPQGVGAYDRAIEGERIVPASSGAYVVTGGKFSSEHTLLAWL